MGFEVNTLKKLLEDKGISQSQLARACDYIAPNTISEILSKRRTIGPRTHVRMAKGIKTLGFSKSEIEAILGAKE